MGRKLLATAAGVLAAVILFWAGGELMLEGLERQLIYYPTRARSEMPTPPIPGVDRVEEVWLRAEDGVRLHGLRVGGGERALDLLFLHGNAGNLYDRLENVAALSRSGFRVLILDYRGYGKSEGRPTEDGLYRDADAAYRYLTEDRDVEPDRLVVFGRSLGAAVAIDLAVREPIGALIVESAFTSAREMARLHYGWIPDAVLRAMTHELDSLEKIERLDVPILLVHGTHDRIVPIEMGRRLYEVAPEPKTWLEIPAAGHNDTWTVGGPEYIERLVAFARSATRR